MKQTRRFLSVILALMMLVSVMVVPVAAADVDYGIQYYVALGDSIAHGMNAEVPALKISLGIDPETGEEITYPTFGTTADGYPSRVADALELENGDGFLSWALPGMRTKDILYMLTEKGDYSSDLYVSMILQDYNGIRPTVRQNLADADLITLNVGMNDILVGPLVVAMYEIALEQQAQAEEQAEAQAMVDAAEDAESPEMSLSGSLNSLNASQSDGTLDFVKRFLKHSAAGAVAFRQNLPQILAELRTINPDAQIEIVGVYNALREFPMDNEALKDLPKLLDGMFVEMNLYIAACCARYNCTYVDVMNVEIDGSFHPTVAGYQDMADRIVAKLKPATAFTDIDRLSPEFQTAINWAVQAGVTKGTTETTFSPFNTCSRAEIVTFLWRMAGSPDAESTVGFHDVPSDAYYAQAVSWAAENGITAGTTSRTFSPNALCTRAQIVTFLYRYDQKFNADAAPAASTAQFSDVSVGAYYGAPVSWAVSNGITKGVSAYLFAPMQPCTRAQAVTFLYRYCAQGA